MTVEKTKVITDKLIISGQHLEYYHYNTPLAVGFNWPSRDGKNKLPRTREKQLSMTKNNVIRTRKNISRLINSNETELDKAYMLSFKNDVLDLETANLEFKKFIQRLTRRYGYFKYISVPEFQPTSKKVHYHVMINSPYISKQEIEDVWQNGFVKIKKIYNQKSLGRYMSKYLTKESFDKRYFKKKKYTASKNLERPIIIDDFLYVMHILKNLPIEIHSMCEKIFETTIYTRFVGTINYVEYKIADFIKIFDPPSAGLLQNTEN